jgi:hypothetical protein
MREAGLRIHLRADGRREVQTLAGDVLAVCASDAEAWRWIDRHSVEGQSDDNRHIRIRQSSRFS